MPGSSGDRGCGRQAPPGAPAPKEAFEKRIPSRLLGSPGVTGIDATVAAWDDRQPWLEEILAQLRANRDWLAARLAAELPGVRMRVPEATYLAWLDCRALELSCPAGQLDVDLPLCMDRLLFATEGILSEVADMYPA